MVRLHAPSKFSLGFLILIYILIWCITLTVSSIAMLSVWLQVILLQIILLLCLKIQLQKMCIFYVNSSQTLQDFSLVGHVQSFLFHTYNLTLPVNGQCCISVNFLSRAMAVTCRTSSGFKWQQSHMRKRFLKIRPANPWKRLSKKAVEAQLFRVRSTSICEDSESPKGPLGTCFAFLVQWFPTAKLFLVYADEEECRWEFSQDWGLRQTGVWHLHIADVSPVSKMRTSSYIPMTSLHIILQAQNTYFSTFLPFQMKSVSSAPSPRYASFCLWQPCSALSPS